MRTTGSMAQINKQSVKIWIVKANEKGAMCLYATPQIHGNIVNALLTSECLSSESKIRLAESTLT